MQQEETRAAAGTGSDPEPAQAAAIREAAQAEPGEAAQLVPGAIREGGSGLSSLQVENEPGRAQQVKDRTSKVIDALKAFETAVSEFQAGELQAFKEGTIDPAQMRANRQQLAEFAERLGNPLQTIASSLQGVFEQFGEGEPGAAADNDLLKAHPQFMASAQMAKLYSELLPYMDAELENNPKIGKEPFDFLIAAAARRARADGKEIPHLKAEDTEQELRKELPAIIPKGVNTLHYPLDKPNQNIWGLLEAAEPNGQLAIHFDTTKKGDEPEKAIVTYSINFDALNELDIKITRQLTPYDKRVYIAAAALWNGGNQVITVTQIYKLMGNRGQPKSIDVQKIKDSVLKMGAAWITIDNEKESAAYKNYVRFPYQGYLLPFEWKPLFINNMFTDAAIHLFREPPMISFAKQRNQITAIEQKVLESPISKTDANLRLEDYLLERIGHMKSEKSKAPNKILYSTLYEKCGITTRLQRSRAPEKIKKYLEHYKTCTTSTGKPFIKGYTMEKDGIIVFV